MHMDGGAAEMTGYNFTQQKKTASEILSIFLLSVLIFFFVSDEDFRTFTGETYRWGHSPMLTHHVQAAVIALKAQVGDVQ